MQVYPIGTPGKPWQATDKSAWKQAQEIKRSYKDQVLQRLAGVSSDFVRVEYGTLPYGELSEDNTDYPLVAFKSANWQNDKPAILISGGVHGYETSGVQGAIDFLLKHALDYQPDLNFVIAPCLSPWGYETINRWNPDAIDPNRSFYPDSPAPEARLFMQFIDSLNVDFLAHFDLHETTDSDDSEFRPALAAREGIEFSDWGIPDGFYTVANTLNPQLDFQKAIVASVENVTHIAPEDNKGQIIAADVVAKGIICYDKKALFLCGGVTDANYVTTTEVYPDSAKSSDEICKNAQVAAIIGGLDYLKAV